MRIPAQAIPKREKRKRLPSGCRLAEREGADIHGSGSLVLEGRELTQCGYDLGELGNSEVDFLLRVVAGQG